MKAPRIEFAARVATSRAIGAEPDAGRIAEIVEREKFTSIDAARAFVREHLDRSPQPMPNDPVARARVCLGLTVKWNEEPEIRNVLVDEAHELDPGNADALRLLADREHDPAKRIPGLERAIEAGRTRLGDVAVAELRGPTWTNLAARPYLRARARLAETLIEAGRFADARAACEALLELDESDGLGMRHRLGTLQLADGDTAAFARLTVRFPDDESGFVRWGRVFAALVDGDEASARASFALAARTCGGVVERWINPWIEPEPYDHYAIGEETEEIVVALELYPVLCRHASLLPWIAARAPRVRPPTNRTRRLLESIRPPDSEDAEPLWLEWLFRSEGRPSAALESAIRFTGDRAIPWILSLLGADELDRKNAPGSSRGPASAARILGRLAPPTALDPLANALVSTEHGSKRWYELLAAIERYGAEALEPLLSARERISAGDAETRDMKLVDVCEPLSHLGVRDDRVFDALCTAFDLETGLGAIFFADYGDPRAIARLAARIEGRRLDAVDESTHSNSETIDVLDALRVLAGSLTPAQLALESRIEDYRLAIRHLGGHAHRENVEHDDDDDYGGPRESRPLDADFADRDVDFGGDDERSNSRVAPPTLELGSSASESAPGPASDDSFLTTGRNAPCPCGSRKKYKKCCWDAKRGG